MVYSPHRAPCFPSPQREDTDCFLRACRSPDPMKGNRGHDERKSYRLPSYSPGFLPQKVWKSLQARKSGRSMSRSICS